MFRRLMVSKPFVRGVDCRFGHVLAIETSCDDTCSAIVDSTGRLLSNVTHVQTPTHNRFGGINPPLAAQLHDEHIGDVVRRSVDEAGVKEAEIDYVAVTNRPGLLACLKVGVGHALHLANTYKCGLIRVHHMRAHALTAMYARQPQTAAMPRFPFLCLLASGGHCILSRVQSPSNFEILGRTLDCAPGDLLDKIARRLRVQHMTDVKDAAGNAVHLSQVSGGRAIEILAASGDPLAFMAQHNFLAKQPNCNFSFSGLRTSFEVLIGEMEDQQSRVGTHIDGIEDMCASLLHTVFRQIARRVQRAIEICDSLEWMSPIYSDLPRQLVLSGGVACNSYLRRGLDCILKEYNYELIHPPPQYCSDNAAMIAWNALLILNDKDASHDVFERDNVPSSLEDIAVKYREPIGTDISSRIVDMKWRVQKRQALNKLKF